MDSVFVEHPSHCAFPIRSGNTAVPLIDGEETFSAIGKAVTHATVSVWVAISFWEPEFLLNNKLWLDALEQTGLEIRLLFWEPGRDRNGAANPLFSHVARALQTLRGGRFQVRFDSSGADVHHCVHEKTWIVDAYEPKQVAFTGGLILGRSWMTTQEHLNGGKHDIYVQIQGSGSADVATSFAQRWNSSRSVPFSSSTEIRIPEREFPSVGSCHVQVQRDIAPNRHGMKEGEASIYRQLELAISNAKSTIYIEQQHTAYAPMLRLLQQAMKRNVQVIYVAPFVVLEEYLPFMRNSWLQKALSFCTRSVVARKMVAAFDHFHRFLCPRHFHCGKSVSNYEDVFLHVLPQLALEPNFCLAALVAETKVKRKSVYVHSKLIVVDDDFYSIGSANCVNLSYERLHTELAVSVAERGGGQALLRRLFSEHAALPLESKQTSRELFVKFRERALANRKVLRENTGVLRGLAHQVDPAEYGFYLFVVSIILELRANRASVLSFLLRVSLLAALCVPGCLGLKLLFSR